MPISTPTQITVPFATSGLKTSIPAASDPITGRAGYDQGFTAINMTPRTAGGIPPFGQDFNGIFFDISTALQFLEAGGGFPYNSTFATAVGGYPLGALVSRSDGSGLWRNTVANNTADPEGAGTGWQPEEAGATSVAMSNANVTLTRLQAARQIITITGTLTANIQLILPTYVKTWLVNNTATGAFTVTVKTAAGSGVAVATGASQQLYGDGTNIARANQGGGQLVRTLRYYLSSGVLNFSINGGTGTTVGASTYAPVPGMSFIDVEAVGGGGAGGGAVNPTAGNVALGAPGSSGSYGRSIYTAAQVGASQAITVGAGGVGFNGAAGGNGGTTSLGSLLVCPGGGGGLSSGAGGVATPSLLGGTAGTSATTGSNINACIGTAGGPSISMAATTVGSYGGAGGGNPLAAPTSFAGANTNGIAGSGFGAGGSGLAILNGAGPATGPKGFDGVIIIREYA